MAFAWLVAAGLVGVSDFAQSTMPEGPGCASGFLASGATLSLKPGKHG